MTRYRWLLMALLCLATVFSVACSTQEEYPAQTAPTAPAEVRPETAPTTSPADLSSALVTTGELLRVDLAANTFAIRTAEGTEEILTFSESTQVFGAASAQGLSSQTGSQVRVYYIEQDGQKRAIRVETS
jgi:hypothetical protein